LQCGSSLTLYSEESKAQCLSFQPFLSTQGAMPVLSTRAYLEVAGR
jgi:hypothetical protein